MFCFLLKLHQKHAHIYKKTQQIYEYIYIYIYIFMSSEKNTVTAVLINLTLLLVRFGSTFFKVFSVTMKPFVLWYIVECPMLKPLVVLYSWKY